MPARQLVSSTRPHVSYTRSREITTSSTSVCSTITTLLPIDQGLVSRYFRSSLIPSQVVFPKPHSFLVWFVTPCVVMAGLFLNHLHVMLQAACFTCIESFLKKSAVFQVARLFQQEPPVSFHGLQWNSIWVGSFRVNGQFESRSFCRSLIL